jgi:hypothetical protein
LKKKTFATVYNAFENSLQNDYFNSNYIYSELDMASIRRS